MIRDEDMTYWAKKNGHTYLAIVAPGREREAIQAVYQWAANPELPDFDFEDAHNLSEFIESCPPDAGWC